jgi:type I restriction enzyme M protein
MRYPQGGQKTDEEITTSEQDELDQAQAVVIDLLSCAPRPVSEVEELVQRTIHVLAEEYGFPLEAMARDVAIPIEVNGRRQRKKADLVVFAPGHSHDLANTERIVVVRKPGTKPSNLTNGTELLKQLLDGVDACEFGLWTNGRDVVYLRKRRRPVVNDYEELIDFPGVGEALDDLDRPDRRMPARVAVADDLRDTVLRCHDYLYGNQSMQAPRVFSEMVKLIFSKIYDERLLRRGGGHTRQFWVGLTERNTQEGKAAIAARVRSLFARMKKDPELGSAFRPQDEIELRDAPLAWVAAELARYQFLDAELDVKGTAYEAIVASTMKRERGQFFTPPNVVTAMVEILAPEPHERVLDPACGSGRFLVACLDRFRQRAAESRNPRSRTELRRLRNSPEVIADASAYARECLFGIDVDPELVRAARMYMLLNNDGHGNLFELNSLEVSERDLAPDAFAGAEELQFGSFNVVLTNPPFGSAIPIDDPDLLLGYDLGHRFIRDEQGGWLQRAGDLHKKMPPEVLFIERCLKWLKPGGRMGIVVPDGILGNPDNEAIRAWILRHTRVLASVDLPVEAFLPQVGVQASLLFLQKRSDAEVSALTESDYPIFMAIAEQVGHDRRGLTVYRRDPDGFEVYKEQRVDLEVLHNGERRVESRMIKVREEADDLPVIAKAYREWVKRVEMPTVA